MITIFASEKIKDEFDKATIDIVSHIEAISDLVVANNLTGLWDNRRFNLCKKPYEEFTEEDKAYLYTTEKNSRKNVENRAVQRKILDKTFQNLVTNKEIWQND